MTTLENAARMALEALQLCANGEDDVLLTRDALAALHQALEQPVNWQEIECPCCGDLARAFPPAQPKQEPVAWIYDWKTEGVTVTDYLTSNYDEAHSPTMGCTNIRPLYTEPPKREWVGLTDGEMTQVANTAETYTESVKLTEAALKELNT